MSRRACPKARGSLDLALERFGSLNLHAIHQVPLRLRIVAYRRQLHPLSPPDDLVQRGSVEADRVSIAGLPVSSPLTKQISAYGKAKDENISRGAQMSDSFVQLLRVRRTNPLPDLTKLLD